MFPIKLHEMFTDMVLTSIKPLHLESDLSMHLLHICCFAEKRWISEVIYQNDVNLWSELTRDRDVSLLHASKTVVNIFRMLARSLVKSHAAYVVHCLCTELLGIGEVNISRTKTATSINNVLQHKMYCSSNCIFAKTSISTNKL